MKLHPLPRLSRYSFALLLGFSLLRAESPSAWQTEAKEQGLNAAEIKLLAEQNMVITGMEVPQIFSPYSDLRMPVFITSDTVISGFNALLQESMRLLELRQAAELQPLLNLLQTRIGEREAVLLKAYQPAELAPVGIKRARLILATAQVLLGAGKQVPASLREEAQSTAARLEKAQGIVFPEWLGKPSPEFLGMNAESFKPLSFYAEQPVLARYFRAETMLQSAALMISDDASIVAASVLGNAMRGGDHEWEEDRKREDFFGVYQEFFGPARALSIGDAARWAEYDDKTDWRSVSGDMNKRRQQILKLPTASSNDLIATEIGALSMRVWPSAEFADNIYLNAAEFQRKTARSKLFVGLEIAAALHSPTARTEMSRVLEASECKALEKTMKGIAFTAPPEPQEGTSDGPDPFRTADQKVQPSKKPEPPLTDLTNWSYSSTHYQRYLSCLSALLDVKEPEAPALFDSPAWQAKSCQTVMAGWAHMRHAMALQARNEVLAGCILPESPGFVEPDPTFFGMMARLAEAWQKDFEKKGTFRINESSIINRVREDLAALSNSGTLSKDVDSFFPEDEKILESLQRMRSAPWPSDRFIPEYPYRELSALEAPQDDPFAKGPTSANSTPAQLKANEAKKTAVLANHKERCEKWIKQATSWWEQQAKTGTVESAWRELYELPARKLEERWQKFITLSQRLESMAHRQLRGLSLLDADRKFILGYGYKIGNLMGYEGSTYMSPRDDAPLCALITHDPKSGVYLHAGITRPRLFYILYPGKSGAVLLRGAVNCYDEGATSSPLTDKEWMNYQNLWPKVHATWLQVISPDELPRKGRASRRG